MTLTEATFWTKILLKLSIIGIIFITLIYYVIASILKTNPTQQLVFKPDYSCGTLPKLEIKSITYTPSQIDINIPAEQEILPILPNIAYVYKIDITGETFSTREKAMSLAKALNFDPQNFIKTDLTHYIWTDSLNSRSLIIDSSTLNFVYSYNNWYPQIPNLKLPPLQTAPIISKNILSKLGLFDEEIKNGKTTSFAINFTSYEHEVDAIQQAHVIRTDFQKVTHALVYDSRLLQNNNKSNIAFEDFAIMSNNALPEEYRITYDAVRVSDNPYTGNISVYIKDQENDIEKSLYKLVFNNWRIQDRPCGTYPIISPTEALSLVKNNKAYLVHISRTSGDRLNNLDASLLKSITIFNIELAYYEPNNRLNSFLQPIYIVEGNAIFKDGTKGFAFFYVPAIRGDQ